MIGKLKLIRQRLYSTSGIFRGGWTGRCQRNVFFSCLGAYAANTKHL